MNRPISVRNSLLQLPSALIVLAYISVGFSAWEIHTHSRNFVIYTRKLLSCT